MRLWLGTSRAIQAYMLVLVAVAVLAALLFGLAHTDLASIALAIVVAGLPGFIYMVARRAIVSLMQVRDELRASVAAQEELRREVGDIERYIASTESVLVGALGEIVASATAEMKDALAVEARRSSSAFANELGAVVGGLTRASNGLRGVDAAVGELKAEDRRLFNALQSKLEGLRANMEQVAQSAGEYQSLRSRLVKGDDEPPMLGGWALTAPTLNAIARRILTDPDPLSIMELGSGASTVWIAMTLRERGVGHCTTVEHLPQYADEVRLDLERRGLSEWVTVVDAPLREISLDGVSYNWYERERFPQPRGIDLLLVDGPPGDVSNMARYPALPLLAERLNDGAWVILDDTIRVGEKQTAELWQDRSFSGIRLGKSRSTGKSLIFEVRRS